MWLFEHIGFVGAGLTSQRVQFDEDARSVRVTQLEKGSMSMSYLRNAWYMVAWSDDLGSDKGLARTILDEPIFFYRDEARGVRALFDRCPHRFAPLSAGQVDNGEVTCAYHGLTFNGDGNCVRNPHGPTTKALAVRSYPVAERHRAIWIWMGDIERADPDMITDLEVLADAPETAFSKGYLRGEAHYQLFIDNILDLSHTDYLHPTTLGGGAITRTPVEVAERDDGVITIAWRPRNEVPMPLQAKRMRQGFDKVDSWHEIEWYSPGVAKLLSGAVATGLPRSEGYNSINVHAFTPETHSSTHYFFASTRDHELENAERNEATRKIRAEIFTTEDAPIIAAQQARIGDASFWSLKPALLKIDKGAALVRRRLDSMIAAEQADRPDTQTGLG